MSGLPQHGADSNLPMGRVRRFYGLPPGEVSVFMATDKAGKSIFPDTYRTPEEWAKEAHRLSLEKLRSSYNPYESLAKKLTILFNQLVDEYLLQHHADPKKAEIVRLTKLVSDRHRPNSKGEYRFGKLSVFYNSSGITVRLFQPGNEQRLPPHDLVTRRSGTSGPRETSTSATE